MTDLSKQPSSRTVSDIVRFRSDLFFDGAVQLRWVEDDLARAQTAAQHFVFHGPRYHAVKRDDASDGYVLRDTASFTAELVESLAQGESRQGNPFSLAIAGYGSGKSHLAVTLASMLGEPSGAIADQIVRNVQSADAPSGARLSQALQLLQKPVLTVPLDGMANFNLGAELTRTLIVKLRESGCDLSAIEELSPRFKVAENFVQRNASLRAADFVDALPGLDTETIIERLRERDEKTYSAVDLVFSRANGARIPVDGRESVQDLIITVTANYCGSNGPFSGVLILFDEFGRFLEYAAEHPHLAGDSALQQLFQGVQDSAGRARFLGFIQYDLKAYVSRLDRRDLMHLQRYITRFEAAQKFYLSTNLETLFAHLIEKRDPELIGGLLDAGHQVPLTHHMLQQALPEMQRLPVWSELEQFKGVICHGCWPLDPLAVWFLTRQQDVVQSRSALNVLKSAIERIEAYPYVDETGRLVTVSAADLLLSGMLPDFVAAEQAKGGTIAETLQAILEERAALLDECDRRVLAAVAVLLKLRVRISEKVTYNNIARVGAGVSSGMLDKSLTKLIEDIGVLEWNDDFGQYELIQDAATRGQFIRLLRNRCSDPAAKNVGPLFVNYARTVCNLDAIDPGFSNERRIGTQDWRFDPIFASANTVAESIVIAFRDWRQVGEVNDAKGRVIYTFVRSTEDVDQAREAVKTVLASEVRKSGYPQAPIWVVLLHDSNDRIAEGLQRWWALERGLSDQERERYRRFVSIEMDRVASLAREAATTALAERLHEAAGFEELPDARLSRVGFEIFAKTYPRVVTFPFDGFATGAGTGSAAKKDCLDMIRALVAGEFNDEWIQSRPTRLRNRASQVLARVWGVLDHDGNLSVIPANEGVASVLANMDEWHLGSPEQSLEGTRKRLLAAPYGCSYASADLLLGLLVARKRPRRRLLLDDNPVQPSRWIADAFKTSDLNDKVLARTTIAFLSEDAQVRWQNLLEDWRNCQRHQEKVGYLARVRELSRENAVPDDCLYQYERLVDEAKLSQEAIVGFALKFEKLQEDLERHISRGGNIGSLADCDRLVWLKDEVESGPWEPLQIAEVNSLFDEVRKWVAKQCPGWIEHAHCRSPQQVAEYRNKMDKAERTLTKLEMPKLAEQARTHKQISIGTVDERFRFESTLTDARQFARVASVASATTVADLEALVDRVKRYSELLQESTRTIKDVEADDVVVRLQELRKSINAAISGYKKELEGLYRCAVDSLPSVIVLSERIDKMRKVFAGQRDLQDIEDAGRQLEKIRADLDTWSLVEGDPESVEAELSKTIKARCGELAQWCEDEDIEPIWSFEEIYERFAKSQVEALRERSEQWGRSMLPSNDDLGGMPLEICLQKLKALQSGCPAYLAQAERKRLLDIERLLRERISNLEELVTRTRARQWLGKFDDIASTQESLNRAECERYLHALRQRPIFLNDDEMRCAERLTVVVEGRIDQIDVSDIVNRIRNLKPDTAHAVLRILREVAEQNEP